MSRVISDYRRGLNWLLILLTAYSLTTYDYILQITDTQTSVLSLLHSPLTVSWQRILTQEL
jgi:hypothetical protein